MDLFLKRLNRQLLDQHSQLVFLFLHLLSRCDQLDRLGPLATVLLLLTLLLLQFIDGFLEPLVVLYGQEVVTLVQNASRCVNLVYRHISLLHEVAQDGVSVRVFEVKYIILKLVKLTWMDIGKLQLQSLFPSIDPRILLLLLELLINFTLFTLDPIQSLLLFLFARDNFVTILIGECL